jgi:hypothetical protein
MQYISRYQLKPLKGTEFQEWLLENESLIAENSPEGWSYLGTWFTVRGFGKFDCETRYEIDDYGALGAGFGNETYQRLMREWMEFADMTQTGETYLMKSIADVRIMQGS